MSSSPDSSMNIFQEGWEEDLHPYACGQCQGVFLIPSGSSTTQCPYCCQDDLMSLGADMFQQQELYTQAPEGFHSPTVSQDRIIQSLKDFQRGIPFHPQDLDINQVQHRLKLLYLPFWWVDVQAKSNWNAEMGFDYQVVSHQEYNNNGVWQTKEHLRTQTSWEERLGQLDRTYHNMPAPALEEWEEIEGAIGSFSLQQAETFQPRTLNGSAYQLPTLVPKDAWPFAEVKLHQIAAKECQQASEAQHVRRFHWSPAYLNPNWTQVLVPVYTSFYRDDEGQANPLLIHGMTGKLYGQQRSSVKKAKKIAIQIGLIGLAVIGLALGLLYFGPEVSEQDLLKIGAFLLLALAGIALSRVPVAKSFNRKQIQSDIWKL